MLACELRLAGCSVQVLEQASEGNASLLRAPFGLRGLSPQTLDSFDRRGMLAPLEERIPRHDIAAAAPWMQAHRRPAGHFAGIDFFQDQIDRTQWPYRLPHSPGPVAADLESIIAVLTGRALGLGVSIRRGCAVSAVDSAADGVVVSAGGESFRAHWLVGCDGARSMVRKTAGFDFTGTEPKFTGYFAQIELADAAMLEPGHHDMPNGTYIFDLPGTIRMVEFDGGAFHRTQPITRDHVQEVLRLISGRPVVVTALGLSTTWTDRAFLATKYRRGRVLLAGDAAHIHSPLGGQGLNLGLGDAMNLGWKLAAKIRGDAAAGLLDSYERERRPIAEQILDRSRAQVALMQPDPSAKALGNIIRDLIATRDGATYFAERVWGVGLRYVSAAGDHALVGRSAPDFELCDGTFLNAHLRDGGAVLLDFDQTDALQAVAARYAGRVSYLGCSAKDRLGLHALLVRPDGFVVWASDCPTNRADAAGAISRWLGKRWMSAPDPTRRSTCRSGTAALSHALPIAADPLWPFSS